MNNAWASPSSFRKNALSAPGLRRCSSTDFMIRRRLSRLPLLEADLVLFRSCRPGQQSPQALTRTQQIEQRLAVLWQSWRLTVSLAQVDGIFRAYKVHTAMH